MSTASPVSPRFLRFAAICCFLSVITTLGIHLFFPEPSADPEKRLLLYRDAVYIVNRWWIIFHCLFVIVSMWGFYLVQKHLSPGFAGLGFLFFAVFGIAEITRQQFVLFYMNGLREQYAMITDTTQRVEIGTLLRYAGQLSSPLYGLFVLAFGLGNLCYGISLVDGQKFSKLLGMLLITWSVFNFLSLANSFWHVALLDTLIGKLSFTFQPLMRILLAAWLWKKAREAAFLMQPG